MDAKQVLQQALTHLDTHGWSHQGRFTDDEGRLTLLGAMMKAHDDLYTFDPDTCDRIWRTATRALRDELESRPGTRNAFDYNNRVALGASDVRSVIIGAASRV